MKQNLSREVYDVLLERLLNQELIPGEILNRRAVAEEFGTSVAPVLEAMLELESEGFLESIPRKGTLVRPIREQDARGHLIVREALECQAARMYCGQPMLDHEDELMALAEEVDAMDGDSKERSRRDIELHKSLMRLAGSESLIEEYNRVMKVRVFHIMNRFLTQNDKKIQLSHSALIENLKVRDPDKAEKVMREHLRSGKLHFLEEG